MVRKKAVCIVLLIIILLVYFVLGICKVESTIEKLDKEIYEGNFDNFDKFFFGFSDINIIMPDYKVRGKYNDVKQELKTIVTDDKTHISFSLLNSRDKTGFFTNQIEGVVFVKEDDVSEERKYRIEILNLFYTTKIISINII